MLIRVVLAEDNYLLREGDDLLAAVAAENPDIVITDIRMPPDRHRRGDPGGRQPRARWW